MTVALHSSYACRSRDKIMTAVIWFGALLVILRDRLIGAVGD